MLKLMLLQSLYKVGVRGTCSGGSVATTGWVFVKNLNHFNHLRSVTNTSHFPWASNKNLSFFLSVISSQLLSILISPLQHPTTSYTFVLFHRSGASRVHRISCTFVHLQIILDLVSDDICSLFI